jgi:hypothetical protein
MATQVGDIVYPYAFGHDFCPAFMLLCNKVPPVSPKWGMYEILIATHNLRVAVTTSPSKDPANTIRFCNV